MLPSAIHPRAMHQAHCQRTGYVTGPAVQQPAMTPDCPVLAVSLADTRVSLSGSDRQQSADPALHLTGPAVQWPCSCGPAVQCWLCLCLTLGCQCQALPGCSQLTRLSPPDRAGCPTARNDAPAVRCWSCLWLTLGCQYQALTGCSHSQLTRLSPPDRADTAVGEVRIDGPGVSLLTGETGQTHPSPTHEGF